MPPPYKVNPLVSLNNAKQVLGETRLDHVWELTESLFQVLMATGEYWLHPVEPRNKPKPACDLLKAQQYYNDAYDVITTFKVTFSELFDYASVEMKEPLVLNSADCVKAQLYIAQLVELVQHDVVAKLEKDIATLLEAAEALLDDDDAWAKAKTIHDEMSPEKHWFIFSQKLKNTTLKVLQ
jgi:hypothetical protein